MVNIQIDFTPTNQEQSEVAELKSWVQGCLEGADFPNLVVHISKSSEGFTIVPQGDSFQLAKSLRLLGLSSRP